MAGAGRAGGRLRRGLEVRSKLRASLVHAARTRRLMQRRCMRRWDCEESAQVWSSCGDISIKPGGYGGLGVGGKPTTEREQRLAGGR